MTLNIQRLHADAVLPTRAHEHDAGLDLYAAERVGIPVLGRNLVGTGIAVAIPPGHVGYITPRSGLAHSNGITVLNAPGTIDSGYVGEIRVNLINHGQAPHVITPGQRIAQLVIHPIITPTVVEVDELPDTERGTNGHGSSGK
ncbi:MAG: dUTP diphosphatase [Yaniella sp.]|nr:dUTP diphosphatase [Yaniella sp.]